MDFVRMTPFTFFLLQILVCNAEEYFNLSEGVVQSPDYPDFYPGNLRKKWRITVRETFVIRLWFTFFHFQQRQQGKCPDQLQIYDGEDENNAAIFDDCGRNVNMGPFFSSGNQLFLKMSTDEKNQKKGFSANFKSIPLKVYSREINSTEGVVQSLRYPDSYPNNLRQAWLISTRETFMIRLVFTNFDLQNRKHGVCKDKLKIFDGRDENSGKIFERCGKPPTNLSPVLSTGNQLFLKLITDGSNRKTGFSANFTSVPTMAVIAHLSTAVSESPSATTTSRATIGELFYSTDEYSTVTSFDSSRSLMESRTKVPRVSNLSRSSDPGLYVAVPSIGVVLCLLVFGLSVILKKRSMKKSFPSATNYSYQDAMTTNPDSNVPDQQGCMSEDCRNGRCNATPLTEIATRDSHGEEYYKAKASASSEGETLNIVYESYHNKVNEKVDLGGKDGSLIKSDIVCHEYNDVTKQNATYESVDDKRSLNIIYESYDDKTNEEMELKGGNFMLTKSDMECHEDDDVTKQNTTYEAVDHNQPDNDVYDEVRPTEDKGLEVNIIYEPYEGNR